MSPLELLYEPPRLPALALPEELAQRYGGTLGFDGPCVYANFVQTLDGVVAIPGLARSNRLISEGSEADRFVMALLRACADAILVGSGTLQASARSVWTAEAAFPPLAGSFAALREGREPLPELVVVTGSGMVDPAHPAFERGALVLTTDGGAKALRGRLPSASELESVCAGPEVDLRLALELLRARGRELVLVEAGPHVLGSMLEAGLVDELFLTISPLLAGRAEAATRLGLVEGLELLPDVRLGGRLLGVRRGGEQLLLRYALRRPSNGGDLRP